MATATAAVEGVLSHAADVGAGDAAAVLRVLPTAPPASIRLPLQLTFAMPTKKGAHCGDAYSIAASLAAWHLCTICLLRLLMQMQQDIHV